MSDDGDQRALGSIRPLSTADIAACVGISTRIAWKSKERTWHTLLGVGDGFGLELDGALIGTVLVHRFGDTLATISMMMVDPRFQRRGVATRLMKRALAIVPNRIVCLYATEAGRPVYQRIGFVEQGAALRVDGQARRVVASDALRVMRESDLTAAIALDARGQGAPRTELLRSLFGEAARAFVIERGAAIGGYGLARIVAESYVVGPIVADREDDARAIADALSADSPMPIRIDLEPGEHALVGWAREAGLSTGGETPRMVLGGRVLPGERRLVRAVAARAFG